MFLVTNFRQEAQHLTKSAAVRRVAISDESSPTQLYSTPPPQLDIHPKRRATELRQIRDLLTEFYDCYATTSEVRQTTVTKDRIVTNDDALPVHPPPSRVSPKECEAIHEQVQETLNDTIQPSSIPWASPVVL